MDAFKKSRKCRSTHRAVAPVIATLLMVAIAVVGGTIIFVFSQGFFNQAQISGTLTIESIKIVGYDARDVTNLEAHDGVTMTVAGSNPGILGKNVGENVIVYMENDSVGPILFSEIRLGGAVYNYQQVGAIPAFTVGTGGTYTVMDNSTHGIIGPAGIAQPGETIGVHMDLIDSFPIGRDAQFKLTTTNGAVFVGTIVMGQSVN